MSAHENYEQLKEEVYNLAQIHGRDPHEIKIVVITKNQMWTQIMPVYQAGSRDFGENRLQEALPKMEAAPKDCCWHFVGSLQRNKVKKVLGRFVMIHSVDSIDLAKKISECSTLINEKTPILLQINTSGEVSKHGMSPEACFRNFAELMSLPGLDIQGMMTLAPLVEDEGLIHYTFESLRLLRDRVVDEYRPSKGLPHLSMGMSHDYKMAIAEGATLLRIGTKIWSNQQ